jgi:hypothetical protein
MKKSWISCAVFAALTGPAWGQKVEVQKPDPGQIVHIRTALNHLTILELHEPVVTVAVGSPAFKVEWRENKVFIEPTDDNVATNLFVWTASGRLNYELDPAGSVPEMVFAIDQPPSPVTAAESANKAGPPKLVSPTDVLIGIRAIRMFGAVSDKKRVAVYLRDIYEHDGQLFIRYSISNETERAYTPGVPQVVALNSPRYHQSLYALAHFQLSPREAERVKARGEAPVTVAGAEIESSRIDPGQETTGIVAIKLPETRVHPSVIRLTFLAAPAGPVSAILVL